MKKKFIITHPYLQTILPLFLKPPALANNFKLHQIKLPDGDTLGLHLKIINQDYPLLILIHGLTGSHESHYIKRCAKFLENQKINLGLLNLRGSGSVEKLSKKPYHSGLSQDINETITYIGQNFSFKRIIPCGFSLGANLVLKYAMDFKTPPEIQNIIAVCPPCDLRATVEKINKSPFKMFDSFFAKEIMRIAKLNGHNLDPKLNGKSSLMEVDHYYTALTWGYRDAYDYYQKASTYKRLDEIQIPCSILTAADDPIVSNDWVTNLSNKMITHTQTALGGHVGFFESMNLNSANYLENYLLENLNINLK